MACLRFWLFCILYSKFNFVSLFVIVLSFFVLLPLHSDNYNWPTIAIAVLKCQFNGIFNAPQTSNSLTNFASICLKSREFRFIGNSCLSAISIWKEEKMGLFESSLERINARLGPLDKHHQTPCYSYHPSSEGILFKHVQCTSTCLIQNLAKFEKNITISKKRFK